MRSKKLHVGIPYLPLFGAVFMLRRFKCLSCKVEIWLEWGGEAEEVKATWSRKLVMCMHILNPHNEIPYNRILPRKYYAKFIQKGCGAFAFVGQS